MKIDVRTHHFHANQLKNKFRFVVKLHQATKLHYDLRLEVTGKLKSWVIEIGDLSMKANSSCIVKMTPDHNPNFIYREGVINSTGGYGNGEMIVYDRGVYFPKGCNPNCKIENKVTMQAMLDKNNIEFFLMGHRLKGKFRLEKLPNEQKLWKLTKLTDEYCHTEDMGAYNNSIISGLTLEDIQKNYYRKVG